MIITSYHYHYNSNDDNSYYHYYYYTYMSTGRPSGGTNPRGRARGAAPGAS